MTKQSVITEALKLPELDRLAVVEALYESLDGVPDADLQQAWSNEIERRLKSLDNSPDKTLTWDKARNKIVAGDDEHASGT